MSLKISKIKNIFLFFIPIIFIFSINDVKADTLLFQQITPASGSIQEEELSTLLNFSIDKNIYNVGDTIHWVINTYNTSYYRYGTSITNLNDYLMPDGRTTIGINGIGTAASSCSYSGSVCVKSFQIPSTFPVAAVAPWVNHGPPYSQSEMYTYQKSIFTSGPDYNGYFHTFIYPGIRYQRSGGSLQSMGAMTGGCSYLSERNANPPIWVACWGSKDILFKIINPASSTPPQIFVK